MSQERRLVGAEERFAKVPMFALDAAKTLGRHELLTYLACVKLAGFTRPRNVRAAVSTIALEAGIDRTRASRALVALALPAADRPALVRYRRGANQYVHATVTILECACADGAQAEDIGCADGAQAAGGGCADSAHLPAHPSAHPRHLSPAETTPSRAREPEKDQPEGLPREIAGLLSRAGRSQVSAEQVSQALGSLPFVVLASDALRAARQVSGASAVRSPLGLFKHILSSEGTSREPF